jgi:hypothetical protein
MLGISRITKTRWCVELLGNDWLFRYDLGLVGWACNNHITNFAPYLHSRLAKPRVDTTHVCIRKILSKSLFSPKSASSLTKNKTRCGKLYIKPSPIQSPKTTKKLHSNVPDRKTPRNAKSNPKDHAYVPFLPDSSAMLCFVQKNPVKDCYH